MRSAEAVRKLLAYGESGGDTVGCASRWALMHVRGFWRTRREPFITSRLTPVLQSPEALTSGDRMISLLVPLQVPGIKDTNEKMK